MNESGEHDPRRVEEEVLRILSAVPVRASTVISHRGFVERLAAVLSIVEILVEVDEDGGLVFLNGVEPEDQPLAVAIEDLVARRFGQAR